MWAWRWSPREAEVLEAVGHHLTNAEIATQLFISVRTVESHVSALLRKLSLPDRRALASYAAAQRNHAAVRAPIEQEIRFCAAPDGVRLAWAKSGKGPTIVKAANWLTHLEYDWDSPVWRHWLEGLSERHTLIRYDERGCGLSDRETKELSLECWVADLETVVDAAGLNRFVLLGISQGAATAIAYAVRHPDRVDGWCSTAATPEDGAGAAGRNANVWTHWYRPFAPAGPIPIRRFAVSSRCSSYQREARSRWLGTTSFSASRPLPRLRFASTKPAAKSTSAR